MRDTVTWGIIVVACTSVAILGYRYYTASQEIALLTEKTKRLSAELEGVTEVHQLTETKAQAKERQAKETIVNLTRDREKLKAEVQGLQTELAKTKRDGEKLQEAFAATKRDVQRLENNLKGLQEEKGKLEAQMKTLKSERDALQGLAQRLTEEQKKLRAELQVWERELRQATLLQAERSAEIHQLTETLRQREESITLLKRRVAELEARLGPQPTSPPPSRSPVR